MGVAVYEAGKDGFAAEVDVWRADRDGEGLGAGVDFGDETGGGGDFDGGGELEGLGLGIEEEVGVNCKNRWSIGIGG